MKWLTLVCLLVAAFSAAGCAPTKVPTAEVPAGYRNIRLVGGSIGGDSSTTVMAYAALFNRYYPEIEWSSTSGSAGTSTIYLSKGTMKVGTLSPPNYIDAYGFDKIPESRLRSINLARPLIEYVILIPEDKPWRDITEVPKGSSFSPGTPATSLVLAGEAWLRVAGLSKNDFNWVPLGKTELADAWRNAKLDIALTTVSAMTPYLMDMYMSPRKFKLMGLSPEQVAKAKADGTFERMGFDGPAMGQISKAVPELFKYDVVCPQSANYLVSRDDFPEEIAYRMAKVIDEHHADLVQIYPATKFGATPQHHIKWAKPPLDIHSGVAKYYREKGYLK